jgi:hypothetical protein
MIGQSLCTVTKWLSWWVQVAYGRSALPDPLMSTSPRSGDDELVVVVEQLELELELKLR